MRGQFEGFGRNTHAHTKTRSANKKRKENPNVSPRIAHFFLVLLLVKLSLNVII